MSDVATALEEWLGNDEGVALFNLKLRQEWVDVAALGFIAGYEAASKHEWGGLTDEEVMVAAYQAGFDIHEDDENEDDPEAMHWWTSDGEICDDSLLKLRDLIEAKLKEKNA